MGCLCVLCILAGFFFPPLWILAIVFAILALVSGKRAQQVVVMGPGGYAMAAPQAKTSPLAWLVLVGIIVVIGSSYLFGSNGRKLKEAQAKAVEERQAQERKDWEEKRAKAEQGNKVKK